MNSYVQSVYEGLKQRNPYEKEFLQAAWEILSTLAPVFQSNGFFIRVISGKL